MTTATATISASPSVAEAAGSDSHVTQPPAQEPAPLQSPAGPAQEPRPRKWTVREFMRMVELGLLSGRVDLVNGEVVEMPAAVGNPHAISRARTTRWLHDSFPPPYFIRSQETHAFSDELTREPDVAVLTREPQVNDLIHELPLLVIEVSDDSLHYDLAVKRLEYARMSVPEYWVIDIPHRRVRIFRDPDPAATDPERAYRVDLIAERDQEISPICRPEARTTPAALLPPSGLALPTPPTGQPR